MSTSNASQKQLQRKMKFAELVARRKSKSSPTYSVTKFRPILNKTVCSHAGMGNKTKKGSAICHHCKGVVIKCPGPKYGLQHRNCGTIALLKTKQQYWNTRCSQCNDIDRQLEGNYYGNVVNEMQKCGSASVKHSSIEASNENNIDHDKIKSQNGSISRNGYELNDFIVDDDEPLI
jgi:hypothetical protein